MNCISPHDSLKLPDPAEHMPPEFTVVERQPVWLPFHVRRSGAEMELFEEGEEVTAASVIARLGDEYDGFLIGLNVGAKTPQDISMDMLFGVERIYVPGERCSVAEFAEVEAADQSVAAGMIINGIKEALKVTNGYLPWHPDFVVVVGQPAER